MINPDNIQKLFGALGINEATIYTPEGEYYFKGNPAEKTFLFFREGKRTPSEYTAVYPFAPAEKFTPKELHIALREENIQEASLYLDAGEFYYLAETYNEFSYGLEGTVPENFDITGEPGAAPHLAVEMANQREVLG